VTVDRHGATRPLPADVAAALLAGGRATCLAAVAVWAARQARADDVEVHGTSGRHCRLHLGEGDERRFDEIVGEVRRLDGASNGNAVVGNVPGVALYMNGFEDETVVPCEVVVSIALESAGGAVAVRCHAATFDVRTVTRMVERLATVLVAVTRDMRVPVRRLPLLGEAERVELDRWNATEASFSDSTTVHGLIAQVCDRQPDVVAVEAGDEKLTYAELAGRSNRVAHMLRRRGVGPGSVVGIALERSCAAAVAVLAILKAGGAHCYLDPSYPPDRIRGMVQDAACAVVVTSEAIAGRWGWLADLQLVMDDGSDVVPPQDEAGPEDRAYVVFTSGSTGRPKGIPIHHRAVCNFLDAYRRLEGFSAEDRIFQFLALSFDAWLKDIYMAFTTGATLVFRSDDALASVRAFVRELRDRRVTATALPTAFWHLWMRQVAEESVDIPETLRLVAVCGAAVAPGAVRIWHEHRPAGVRFFNEYGPAECTIDVTLYEYQGMVEDVEHGVPIGPAIANTRLYVVDEFLQPVPVGVEGELLIGGANVARGYLGRPELTRERFLRLPELGEHEVAVYRTGDIVRRRGDGQLVFCGRADFQVKVRGNRVELGEVERHLEALPGVDRAVVVAQQDTLGENVLVAFWTGSNDGTAGRDTMVARLRERVPSYMVPSRFVRLSAWPLTPGGKVDRTALVADTTTHETVHADGDAGEMTGTERVVRDLWLDALGLPSLPRDEDFFSLGGHSLLATQVLSAVGRRFSCEPTLDWLLARPTIAGLAARIDEAVRQPVDVVEPSGAEGPCTASQERFWLLEKLLPDTTMSRVPVAIEFRGLLCIDSLQRALADVVTATPAMRTVFSATAPPRQRLVEPPAVTLVIRDGVFASGLREAMHEAMARHFDLTAGPLFATTLFRLEPARHVLLVTVHHIAFDGASVRPFCELLGERYRLRCSGAADGVPEGDGLVLVRQALREQLRRASASYGERLESWRRRLDGSATSVTVPPDIPRPSVQSHRCGRTSLHLDAALVGAVDSLARRAGTTRFVVVLSALLNLLIRLDDGADATVGVPVALRGPSTEHAVGSFLNTLVARGQPRPGTTVLQFVADVGRMWHQALLQADVALEDVLQVLQVPRDPARAPLFQIFLNMYSFERPRMDFGENVDVRLLPDEVISAEVDMNFYVVPDDDGLCLVNVYCADLYRPETAAVTVRQVASILRAMVASPEQALDDVSLVTDRCVAAAATERPPLDASWKGSVLDLFRRWVAERPESPALEGPNHSVTYGELDRRVRSIAAGLRRTGVGEGDVVVIAGRRQTTLLEAVLAVLDVGAVFVVTDPGYAADRTVRSLEGLDLRSWIELERDVEQPALVEDLLRRRGVTPFVLEDGYECDGNHVPAVVGPDSPACILVTSGSTGRPQAVLGRHGSLTHFVPWMQTTYELGQDDRYSLASGLAHSVVQREMFTPLTTGARVVVPPEDVRLSARFGVWLRQKGITVAHFAPASIDVVARSDDGPNATIRRIFFTGEPLAWRRVAECRRLFPRALLVNSYGATEGQRAVVQYVIPDDESVGSGNVPAGRPIADVATYLLRVNGTPVGVNEPGEIFLCSRHIALGYVGDDEATRRRFVVPPWGGDVRAFRTGDRGRLRFDGVLQTLGRRDRQVQIRGHRIELAEIEQCALRHPAIRRVRATVEGTAGEDTAIRLYYVTDGRDVATEGLVEHFLAVLPAPMLPSSLLRVAALPLTPNGKVDDRALAAMPPWTETATEIRDVDEPATPWERRLEPLWRATLQLVGPVPRRSSFFVMGGTSLSAIGLFEDIRREFGVSLPVSTLYEAPTLTALADRLRSLRVASPLVELASGPPSATFVCVHSMNCDALAYRHVAAASCGEIRFLSLRPPMAEDGYQSLTTADDVLDAYTRVLLASDIDGPMVLGGHSLGGVIAVAVAERLRRRGRMIDGVVLLDAYAPGFWDALGRAGRAARAAAFLAGFPRWCWSFVRNNGDWPAIAMRQFRRTLCRTRWLDDLPPDRRTMALALERLFSDYPLQSVDGPLVLLRASEERIDALHAPYDYGWGRFVGDRGLTVVDVAGNHVSMLEPAFAPETARALVAAVRTPSLGTSPKGPKAVRPTKARPVT